MVHITDDGDLGNAAFGDDPGRWPLPSAHSPVQLWLRAVAAGGQGRYCTARADLARIGLQLGPHIGLQLGRQIGRQIRRQIRRCESHPALVSLAFSTQASFLRQQGWHRRAARWDGRAAALAWGLADDPLAHQARGDALLGLAADAVGVGRVAVATTLLDRVRTLIDAASPTAVPRLAIRLAWVSAEVAMVSDDGAAAVRYARHGLECATQADSDNQIPIFRRHRIKSAMVLAAALNCAGLRDEAQVLASGALCDAQDAGLVPLCWALTSLLGDIASWGDSESRDSSSPRELSDELIEITQQRDYYAGLIAHRSGNIC